MMLPRCLVVVLVFACLGARGAAPGQYHWDSERSRFSLSAEEEKMPELMLKNHVQYEYTFENNEFVMYSTHHRIVYVNSNEAIQRENRIFISMNNTLALTTLKARSINRAGKAVYFDESNLKEIKEEATGNAYRIFAMEGVELGSEVEYYYTRKMAADMFNRELMQFDMPAKRVSMMLSSPQHLMFDFKTYNGLPDVKHLPDSSQNVYELVATDVPATKEEPYASPVANRKRVEFKLAYNVARSSERLYTWATAATRFYPLLTTVTKEDHKEIKSFITKAKLEASLSATQRIRRMERIIKQAINIDQQANDEALGAPESILKYKVASKEGITRLYLAVFEQMGIKAIPVLTCSRQRFHFDGDFDTWSYLDDYFIYFPDTKGFLAPYFQTRYPLIPGEYAAQKGLFIEPLKAGQVESAVGIVKEIPAASYLANQDNLDIDVRFDDGLESNTIRQLRSFTGYQANYMDSFNEMINEEKRRQMVDGLVKQTIPDAQLKEWSVKSSEKNDLDWFQVDAMFKTSGFIEKAGPRVLFKAGLLIGPQLELYRDDKRTMPVENDNNRNFDRIIRIHLPAGYTVKNADQLNMNLSYNGDENTPFLFKSVYATKGDILEITITEFYKDIYVPLERYEDFRKVINASADFNKVTLILEKAK